MEKKLLRIIIFSGFRESDKGLKTFDPETDSQTQLDALISI